MLRVDVPVSAWRCNRCGAPNEDRYRSCPACGRLRPLACSRDDDPSQHDRERRA
jgi:lipopolysaccharide biosynthesis regulator YciM